MSGTGCLGSERELAAHSRALKTLIVPGGIGSTHKVLILGKGVGAPQLCRVGQVGGDMRCGEQFPFSVVEVALC